MLLVPLEKPINWKSPPVVTILLIVVNALIFFIGEARDEQRMDAALTYYAGSHLPGIEVPLYRSYLESHGQVLEASNLDRELGQDAQPDPQLAAGLVFDMDANAQFMRELRQGSLFKPGSSESVQWQAERAQFDALLGEVVWYHYGLKPAFPTAVTVVSHMFLHADIGHLLGNMLILGLIGYVVEAALGSRRYLAAYLLAGLASGGLDILIRSGSGITSIGASGAIAGVMGMYAVLFGLRKIRFFYWLVFYFDYVRAPAIIMLPLWLANEFYQMFLAGPTRVNNLAHIGGLCAGALIALFAKKSQRSVDEAYLDEAAAEENYRKRYAEGLRYMAALNTQQAERIFRELYAERPDDRNLLVQFYNVAKLSPASDQYHELAHRILNLSDKDRESVKLQHRTYNEYFRIAKPSIRWSPAMLLSLARRFSAAGFLEDAEKIINILVKSPTPQLAPALLALGTACAREQQAEKSRQYLTLLLDRYPESEEAGVARQILGKAAKPQ